MENATNVRHYSLKIRKFNRVVSAGGKIDR